MNRRKVISNLINVFPYDGGTDALVDAMQITLWLPKSTPYSRRPVVSPIDIVKGKTKFSFGESQLSLKWTTNKRRPFLSWKTKLGMVRQYLGSYGWPTSSDRVSQTINVNPLRMVREELEKTNIRIKRKHRAKRVKKTNFVHPEIVDKKRVRKRIVKMLPNLIDELIDDYLVVLKIVFGVTVERTDVHIKVSKIELAWDVRCEIPGLALRAFESPWLRGLPLGKRVVYKKERRGKQYTPQYIWNSDGTLRATHSKGHHSKLYSTCGDALRFESQIYSKSQKEILGHSIGVNSSEEFSRDLQLLGNGVYWPIQQVQHELENDQVMNIVNAVLAGLSEKQKAIRREIMNALFATGRVYRPDPAMWRVLKTMERDGAVRKAKPKGYWEATPSYFNLLEFLRRYGTIYGKK